MAGTGTQITFDGYDLQTANIITQQIDHENNPTKALQTYGIAHGNRSVVAYVDYPDKQVTISGAIIGTSVTDVDARVDAFKNYFIGQDKSLDIGYNTGTRRYTCTPNQVNVSRPGGLMYANFSVTFFCSHPFGRDIALTTLLNQTARTASSYSDAVTFTGSAPYQYPIATFTITAFTLATGDAGTLRFGNGTTGQLLNVNHSWAAGDVVAIDTFYSTVKINGVINDFSGAFPLFGPGSQIISSVNTFATCTINTKYEVYPRYL